MIFSYLSILNCTRSKQTMMVHTLCGTEVGQNTQLLTKTLQLSLFTKSPKV